MSTPTTHTLVGCRRMISGPRWISIRIRIGQWRGRVRSVPVYTARRARQRREGRHV
jgi:hypothetical protein